MTAGVIAIWRLYYIAGFRLISVSFLCLFVGEICTQVNMLPLWNLCIYMVSTLLFHFRPLKWDWVLQNGILLIVSLRVLIFGPSKTFSRTPARYVYGWVRIISRYRQAYLLCLHQQAASLLSTAFWAWFVTSLPMHRGKLATGAPRRKAFIYNYTDVLTPEVLPLFIQMLLIINLGDLRSSYEKVYSAPLVWSITTYLIEHSFWHCIITRDPSFGQSAGNNNELSVR